MAAWAKGRPARSRSSGQLDPISRPLGTLQRVFAALAVVLGIIGWWAREASRWLLAAVLCIGLASATIGALAGADGYPWSNIAVLAVAIGGGVLFGRIVPPRAGPMAVVLALLALLDAAQLLFAGASAGGAIGIWFSLLLRDGQDVLLQIGVADLVVVVGIAVHGARRGLGPWPSLLAAPLGLAAASAYSALAHPPEGLVLLPFLLLGWAATEAWTRLRLV